MRRANIDQAVNEELALAGGKCGAGPGFADAATYLSLPAGSHERRSLKAVYSGAALDASAAARTTEAPDDYLRAAEAWDAAAAFHDLINQSDTYYREQAARYRDLAARRAAETSLDLGATGAEDKSLSDWVHGVFATTTADVSVDFPLQDVAEVEISNFLDESGEDDAIYRALSYFEQDIGKHGWHIAQSNPDTADTMEYMLHSNTCRPADVPPYLYHVTSAANVDKILRDGLRLSKGDRRRHSFQYPPRAFFTADPDVALGMAQSEIGGDSLVRIDTSRVPGLALCLDPQFPASADAWESAYSERAIPADAIERYP